jgi:hypothetical protein
MAPTSVVQARITAAALAQLAADAEALGLENTSDALREGMLLLHRKAEQTRLARSYDVFYGEIPAPLSEAAAALWGTHE